MSAGWIKTYPPGTFRGRDGWHVRGKDMYGRAIEGKLPSSVKTAGAAKREAQRALKRSNSEPPPLAAPEPVREPDRSFEAAAKAYRVSRPRMKPVEWARIEKLIACKDIGPKHVAELTTEQVSKFATEAMPHNKPDTLNREIITPYSAVLHFAHELNWRGEPTIRRFPEQEDEIVAVKPSEVDLLVRNVDATASYSKGAHGRVDKNAPYKAALLEFLRLRGARISDVLKLERERDLDLANAQVRLTIGKRRDKVQWLPLSPKLVSMFANLKPCDGVYVFPWRTKSGVYKWWRPLCQRLGINATPHQFRHALGEEAMDADIDLLTLMNLGGWTSLNSARRYARVGKKRLQAADQRRAAIGAGNHASPGNDNAPEIKAGGEKG